ncbi:MAG TPA: hypothetical protein DIS66_06455 [Candidatus Omnitrophica bacterium]|nr:hypothetical protein [Candidatus Omnitrophota bacterium]
MTNTTQEKKVNWLVVISILLAVLLVSQTAGFIYFLNKKESQAKETLDTLQKQNTYASSFPQKAIFQTSPRAHYQDPWSMFDDMQESMNQMMGGFMASLPSMMSQMNQHMGIDAMPLMDMEEKDNAYIVQVDMPGLDKDKIDITVRGEILTIQGQRETINQEQSGSFYAQERSYGSFSRSLRLPGPVDEANIQAEYKNGVLEITLPKVTKEEAAKKVTVT